MYPQLLRTMCRHRNAFVTADSREKLRIGTHEMARIAPELVYYYSGELGHLSQARRAMESRAMGEATMRDLPKLTHVLCTVVCLLTGVLSWESQGASRVSAKGPLDVKKALEADALVKVSWPTRWNVFGPIPSADLGFLLAGRHLKEMPEELKIRRTVYKPRALAAKDGRVERRRRARARASRTRLAKGLVT